MAAFNCGTEAEMFGSLMMFVVGVKAELAKIGEGIVGLLLIARLEQVGEIRQDASASEMSRVSTATPAAPP